MDLINGTVPYVVRTPTPKLDKMSENKVALTKRVTDVSLLFNTDFGEKIIENIKTQRICCKMFRKGSPSVVLQINLT